MSSTPINYAEKRAAELRQAAERCAMRGEFVGEILFRNDAWVLETGKTWLQFNRDLLAQKSA